MLYFIYVAGGYGLYRLLMCAGVIGAVALLLTTVLATLLWVSQWGIVVLLFSGYAVFIYVLSRLIPKSGIWGRWRLALATLVFAAVTGALLATAPQGWDMGVQINLPAAIVGNIIYELTITTLGDPSSPQAHYTVPWIFRIPQVYMLASLLIWAPTGFTLQFLANSFTEKHLPLKI